MMVGGYNGRGDCTLNSYKLILFLYNDMEIVGVLADEQEMTNTLMVIII